MKNVIDFNTDNDLRFMGMEIPLHTCETLHNYLIHGYKPGGFCESMLAKDYDRAITIADTANRQRFWAIATWIRENAPIDSHGSYDIIEHWCLDTNNVRSKFVIEVEKKYIWKELKK